MASKRNSLLIPDSRYTFRARNLNQRLARIRSRYELLESRTMLAAEVGAGIQASAAYQQLIATESPKGYTPTIAPITWFETFSTVERIPLPSLANVDRTLPIGTAGPVAASVGEWIVQLKAASAETVRQLATADSLLDDANDDFTIISGLGTKGSVLVRGQGVSRADIEASLTHNSAVESYSLNQLISGQQTLANDPEFVGGLLPGLEKVNAKNAWDVSRGSLSTVVGVLDSGIDPTHPDLYLNIWINQGELPAKYLDTVGPKLTDIDGDGLITFYDLNNVKRAATSPYALTFNGFATGPNASFVHDLNNNGRIDAIDLLQDANWADGRDTDNNGFFDDFFGVNFRAGAGDAYEANNPSDVVGHGTHVAGTIGAIGGNATGVVGVNWQTSLMSLRILDEHNQGDSGAAIRAVNYAREMRERYRVDAAGRVTDGANVRVLNNSWGQPGGYELSLETAIQDSYEAGILFVAAAGNGNILGNGVDNDKTPFYPASYNVPSVIAVAASDSSDRPAAFSNFGKTTVDLFAPGVGVRSTLPGGGYGSANGTSMASPHVAGTASLIWAALPEATVDEVKQAILSTVDPITNGVDFVSTAGRLDTAKAINANVFAPSARVTAKQDITAAGGTSTEFTVQYTYRSGINTTTIGNDDLVVTRQWGPADQFTATLKAGSIKRTATTATATYIVAAPGGKWDALDFGDYVISTVAGKVTSKTGNQPIQERDIGSFHIQVNDGNSYYIDAHQDGIDKNIGDGECLTSEGTCTLRAAIQESQAHQATSIPINIILTSSVADYVVSKGTIVINRTVKILGEGDKMSRVSGNGLSQLFKITGSGDLQIERVTISGGHSIGNGGAIAVSGKLSISNATLTHNSSSASGGAIFGNGDAKIKIDDSTIDSNLADTDGGAIMLSGQASIFLTGNTISHNGAASGGAILIAGSSQASILNSTISGNLARSGVGFAISNQSINPISLDHITVVDNVGLAFGPVSSGPANVKNSIFANSLSFQSRELSAATSLGGNLVADNSLVLVDFDIKNPGARKQIGPLQDNGGPTKTHALLLTSDGIDRAIFAENITVDQRGVSRAIGEADIGAFELSSSHVIGTVYLDRNENDIQDSSEELLPAETVFADLNLNDQMDSNELSVLSKVDDRNTVTLNESGLFDLSVPYPGNYFVRTQPKDGWRQIVSPKQVIDLTFRTSQLAFPRI